MMLKFPLLQGGDVIWSWLKNPETTLDLGANTIVVDTTIVTPTHAPKIDKAQNLMGDVVDASAKDESVDLNSSTHVLADDFFSFFFLFVC